MRHLAGCLILFLAHPTPLLSKNNGTLNGEKPMRNHLPFLQPCPRECLCNVRGRKRTYCRNMPIGMPSFYLIPADTEHLLIQNTDLAFLRTDSFHHLVELRYMYLTLVEFVRTGQNLSDDVTITVFSK